MLPHVSQPQDCALAPSVHAVAIDDDLVFLDVGSDAYLCVPAVADAVRLDPDGRGLTITDAVLEADLRAAALIQARAPRAPSPQPDLGRACQSAIRSTYPRPSPDDLIEAAFATLDVARHYRGKPFARVLAATADGPPIKSNPSPDLLDLVDAFHRWIPYAPVSGKCLLRAFMLRRFLIRNGHNAHWVFGVTTWPFSAHCWLQCGAVALDEHAERTAAYTPILVK